MNKDKIISQIQEACDWVDSKGLKKGQGISTAVKFVDWEAKLFSPIFAVVWKKTANGLQSMIPSSEDWITIAAEALDTNPTWVWNFVNACYYPENKQTFLDFVGSISESGKVQIKYEPKIIDMVHDKSVIEIAKVFLEKYPAPKRRSIDLTPINQKNDRNLILKSCLNKITEKLIEYYRLTEGN